MAARLTVVISQSQSSNPARRTLEEEIVTQLIMEPGIDVVVIPNLYDLTPDSTGLLALQSISGPMVVCAWLFPRAAHWILDRNHIAGHEGTTLLIAAEGNDDEDDEEEFDDEAADEKSRVVDRRQRPDRRIYCLDLRVSTQPGDFVQEVRRIRQENSMQLVGLGGPSHGLAQPQPQSRAAVNGSARGNGQPQMPTPEQLARFIEPTNDTALGNHPAAGDPSRWLHESLHVPRNGAEASLPAQANGQAMSPANLGSASPPDQPGEAPGTVQRIDAPAERRWYPVIDYSRCTNCMECIDFCLFGVYGVDKIETILVEQPDNCRKGCPACSRVCPENAIMFPQHKTPAIAGSPEVGASLKIDLSELFGAPEQNKSATDIAIAERDEQLLMAGRNAVGDSVGIKLDSERPAESSEKDKLDRLIDQLDAFDL